MWLKNASGGGGGGRGAFLGPLAVTSVGDGMAFSQAFAHRPHAVPLQALGSPGRETGRFSIPPPPFFPG